jgi:hypothetical protein
VCFIRFGREFILSITNTRCAAAVRAQHGDALGQRDVVVAARLRHINATLLISLPVPPVVYPAAAARAHGGRRRREEEAQRVYGWRGGAASFWRADTAKVCSSVGLVSFDGSFECSPAFAATQGVSERLRARQGLRHMFLAATSAFDATSTRHVSTKPLQAEFIRGVHQLKNK